MENNFFSRSRNLTDEELMNMLSASHLQENETFYKGVFILNSKTFQRIQILSYLLFAAGGPSLMMFCIGLSNDPLFENAQKIFGIGSFLLFAGIALYILNFRNAKTDCKLSRKQGKIVLELIHGKYSFQTGTPFSFSVSLASQTLDFRTVTGVGGLRTRINNPVILLFIKNEQGETILLEEILPAWKQIQMEEADPQSTGQTRISKIFTPYPFRNPKLLTLKKILSGLNSLSSPSLR